MPERDHRPVLIAGATGYIGARLTPRLLESGYRVRVLARSPEKIAGHFWGNDPRLEVARGDVLDPESLRTALAGCSAAFYLVHSMNGHNGDFAGIDRQAAQNFAEAAAAGGVERIIYLSGLGDENDHLSKHLRSRAEVATILRRGPVPVTVLRAGVILGAGSASFELLRYLVDRLPVMITPRWIDTPCQPISVLNVLGYLQGCLTRPETSGETYDIGQEEIISYRRLMEIYAEEAGLRRRWIIPVPFLTPKLSSLWIGLIAPLPPALARPLIEGLRNPVLCRDNRIRSIIPQPVIDARKSIRIALEQIRTNQVPSSWSDAGLLPHEEWRQPGDPDWAGGLCYIDARSAVVAATPKAVWGAITCLGGSRGWYYANWLWKARGRLDRLSGGVGLQRGRRCPLDLRIGDAVDFWRVAEIEPESSLLLVAEMKLPGRGVLQFCLRPEGEHIRVVQLARFWPRGLAGILYWFSVSPLHNLVFNGLLRGLCEASGGEVIRGPRRFAPPPEELSNAHCLFPPPEPEE